MYQDQEVLEIVRGLRNALADLAERVVPGPRSSRGARGLDFYRPGDVKIANQAREALETANVWLGENDVPDWKPGDMIQVTFSRSNPKVYTYVRGEHDWPGATRPLSDERVNTLYRNGQVTRGRFVADE